MRASDSSYIQGLTGGIACGKSLVSDELRAMGVPVIDADELSHQLTAPGGEALGAIRNRFSDAVFNDDRTLNRRALGEIVFKNQTDRQALEAILHPEVHKLVLQEIGDARKRGEPIVVLSAPLLFEAGLDALCDDVWVVSLEPEAQLNRLMVRDHLTQEQAKARIDSQMPKRLRDARAGVIIKNDQTPEVTRKQVRQLHRELMLRIQQQKG